MDLHRGVRKNGKPGKRNLRNMIFKRPTYKKQRVQSKQIKPLLNFRKKEGCEKIITTWREKIAPEITRRAIL